MCSTCEVFRTDVCNIRQGCGLASKNVRINAKFSCDLMEMLGFYENNKWAKCAGFSDDVKYCVHRPTSALFNKKQTNYAVNKDFQYLCLKLKNVNLFLFNAKY